MGRHCGWVDLFSLYESEIVTKDHIYLFREKYVVCLNTRFKWLQVPGLGDGPGLRSRLGLHPRDAPGSGLGGPLVQEADRRKSDPNVTLLLIPPRLPFSLHKGAL